MYKIKAEGQKLHKKMYKIKAEGQKLSKTSRAITRLSFIIIKK